MHQRELMAGADLMYANVEKYLQYPWCGEAFQDESPYYSYEPADLFCLLSDDERQLPETSKQDMLKISQSTSPSGFPPDANNTTNGTRTSNRERKTAPKLLRKTKKKQFDYPVVKILQVQNATYRHQNANCMLLSRNHALMFDCKFAKSAQRSH